jgi:hypothetical protein
VGGVSVEGYRVVGGVSIGEVSVGWAAGGGVIYVRVE